MEQTDPIGGQTAHEAGRQRDLEFLCRILAGWAEGKPTIRALYVFGSYARGEARPDSDLDLAVDFLVAEDDALSELITNASSWKGELTTRTGICVRDLYLCTDAPPQQGPRVEVFRR
jgi:predicted nucleotidyltransferase